MKHFHIDALWPDGHLQREVRYAENWRKARALLREQKKDRPTCILTIRRVKPEPRWVLRAYTYRMIREFDRDQKRRENGHPIK